MNSKESHSCLLSITNFNDDLNGIYCIRVKVGIIFKHLLLPCPFEVLLIKYLIYLYISIYSSLISLLRPALQTSQD